MLRQLAYTPIVLLSFGLLTVSGCGGGSQADDEHLHASHVIKPFTGTYPIQVVGTTGPVSDMLRQLGGEHLQVSGMMGPGVDPHLYRAVPSDIERLNAADAIFYNGLHLEGRMADLFERLAQRKPTFAVTHSLVEANDPRLRKPPEFEGYFDPHVWHAPQIWADCAKYVTSVLCELDPAHKEDYIRNGEAYRQQLRDVDQYAGQQLAKIPESQRALVTAHDAFGYFSIAYGLESMPLGGISTEDQVGLGRMDEVIQYLVDHRIRAVFVESAVAPRIVEALIEPCRKAGHEVHIGGELYADALGPANLGTDTYVGMLRANVDTIVAALTGNPPPSD
jgi:manganese/zinc/iron transport system substrate-binding protein